MATFPDVLSTTYLPGSPPVVKAVDLMAFQYEHVRQWRALRGGDLLIADEFTGDTLDRTLWVAPTVPVTLGEDLAAGGFGVARCVPNGRGQTLVTQRLPIGQADFRLQARVRFPFYATAPNAFVRVGLMADQGTISEQFHFEASFGNPHLRIVHQAHTDWDGPPVPIDAYANLEIRRIGGVVVFSVDGVEYHTAVRPSAATCRLGVVCDTVGVPNEGVVYLDSAKLWVTRYPVSSLTG